jgi:SAM-dependent methyltransferase
LLAQKGYSVHGIDLSSEMVEIAKQKMSAIIPDSDCNFTVGNVQRVNLEKTFDAVICMFAVLGYQTTNEQLFSTLKNVRKHLKTGGLFICDFWYGAAVLKERPEERVKIIEKENQKIVRLTKPLINTEDNTVDVNYHLLYLQDKNLVKEIKEIHKMRYVFKPEIEFFLNQVGLELIHFSSVNNLDQPATDTTWNVIAISKAK